MIKQLSDLKKEDLQGKKVILRVDFNVPIADGKVANAYRIERAMPSINFLRENGAHLLLLSHIETKGVDKPSLMPVFEYMKEKFPELVMTFQKSCFGDSSLYRIQHMSDGEMLLFENIRQYGEEKENNEAFAKSLATLGELYVNDAFAVSHRSHASVVGIPKFLPSYAGFQLADEIRHLNVGKDVEKPFLFILGGAKFQTKLPLIQKFLDLADNVSIGGALANDVFKAKGFNIGKSVVSSEGFSLDSILSNPKLLIPTDVITKNGDNIEKKLIGEVKDDDIIMDIGPASIEQIADYVRKARYILWNGPFGNFELGFKDATVALAETVGASGVHSVVGGGDTLAVIQKLNLLDKFTFVSTGGGAMLDYLMDGSLVGIEALNK